MNLTRAFYLTLPQDAQLAHLLWRGAGVFLVMAVGVGMLAWGALARKTGWIILGGVLSGIGLGIVLYEGPWEVPFTQQSGPFLLCFAMGWFLITLLSGIFTPKTQWWALLPGGIMAALGCAILLGGLP